MSERNGPSWHSPPEPGPGPSLGGGLIVILVAVAVLAVGLFAARDGGGSAPTPPLAPLVICTEPDTELQLRRATVDLIASGAVTVRSANVGADDPCDVRVAAGHVVGKSSAILITDRAGGLRAEILIGPGTWDADVRANLDRVLDPSPPPGSSP